MPPFGITVSGDRQRVLDRLDEAAEKYDGALNIIHAVRDHVMILPSNAVISLSMSLTLNYSAESATLGPREVGI